MSQRLVKPGLRPAGMFHPRTRQPIVPLGYKRNGDPIWPVIGGADSDDPDDPNFTGEGDDKDDDDEDKDDDDKSDEDDDDDEGDDKSKKSKRGKDSDDDDDDEDKPVYTQAEYDKMKRRMRAADKRSSDLETRLKALENKGKKPEDVQSEELRKATARAERAERQARQARLENAFVGTPLPNGKQWADPEDAMAVAERLGLLEDVVDEDDGTIDRKALARSLRDLAKRKPHLVKPASGQKSDEDKDDDNDQGSSGTPRMNGKRKGSKNVTDKAALAKRFPALNRF